MPRPPPPLPPAFASPDETELEFYEAMQRGDIERMMAVWSDDDEVSCVHPGGSRLIGAAAIRASFEAMFANGTIQAEPRRVRRVEAPASAVHSVLERVRVMSARGERIAWVVATNVYLRSGEGWRLVAHHASPGTGAEPEESDDAGSTLH